MPQIFSDVYQNLEPHRYFDTIWCYLPDKFSEYFINKLSPVSKYFDWLLGREKDRIPHITLRYLGYDSQDLRKKTLENKSIFETKIRGLFPVDVSFGRVELYHPENKEMGIRLTCKVTKGLQKLSVIHRKLLEVNGFSYFLALEGKNFTPHISVGRLGNKLDAKQKVGNYLKKSNLMVNNCRIDRVELNFVSKKISERLQIKLDV